VHTYINCSPPDILNVLADTVHPNVISKTKWLLHKCLHEGPPQWPPQINTSMACWLFSF